MTKYTIVRIEDATSIGIMFPKQLPKNGELCVTVLDGSEEVIDIPMDVELIDELIFEFEQMKQLLKNDKS